MSLTDLAKGRDVDALRFAVACCTCRNRHLTDPRERFFAAIEKGESCWNWVGMIMPDGYGRISINNKLKLVHRFSYELHKGAIETEYTIDHLCRNKRCVNPDHLEMVTLRENIFRSDGPTARNRLKKACKHGHPFDEANTKWVGPTHRRCRACMKITSIKHEKIASAKRKAFRKSEEASL